MGYRIWIIAVIAGLCGGLAEIAWIGSYTYASSIPAAGIAREIAATVFPGGTGAWAAPLTGVGLHLVLSAALGVSFVAALRLVLRRPVASARAEWALAAGALSVVWLVNFLWVLPALNPEFTTLLPYGVTLASKLLFATAMAGVLHLCRRLALPATEHRGRYPAAG